MKKELFKIILIFILVLIVFLIIITTWWFISHQKTTLNQNTTQSFDLSGFITKAKNSKCTDKRNELYVINKQMVFQATEGSCADASYRYLLYGKTPQEIFCQSFDSFAGQRKECTNKNYQEIFDTILKNLNKSDLGLGQTHIVEKTNLLKNIEDNN